MLPDPCDPNCPDEFKLQARQSLLRMNIRPSAWDSIIQTDHGLREILLKFIADFSDWDLATRAEHVKTSRELVRSAHPEGGPLVVDPFAGEGLASQSEGFQGDARPPPATLTQLRA